jgi:hypothetical protein
MPSQSQTWSEKATEFVATVTRGALRGVRLGPGVLGSISPVNITGLVVALGLVIALRDRPELALVALILTFVCIVYVNERAYRYAQNDPVSALLGGTELLQVIREQMSAKDKSIVADAAPTIASGAKLTDEASDA